VKLEFASPILATGMGLVEDRTDFRISNGEAFTLPDDEKFN
jgi:hypothetical protein